MSFSTDPFTQYHAPGSKEHIELNKLATNDFKPKKQFTLSTNTSPELCTALEENAEDFAYIGVIRKIPTTQTITQPENAEGEEQEQAVITYGHEKDLIQDWNSFDMDTIQKNATLTWGEKDPWTVTANRQIVPLLAERGELTNGG